MCHPRPRKPPPLVTAADDAVATGENVAVETVVVKMLPLTAVTKTTIALICRLVLFAY